MKSMKLIWFALQGLGSILLYPKHLIFLVRFAIQFRKQLRRQRWIQEGRVSKVLQDLGRLIQVSQSRRMIQEEATYRQERGEVYEHERKYELAIEDYHRALEITQSNACRLGVGRCYARIEQYDHAINHLSQVLDEEFIDLAIKACNELGLIYIKQGNVEQAKNMIRTASGRLVTAEETTEFPDPRRVLSDADTRLAQTLLECSATDVVVTEYLALIEAYPYKVRRAATR